MSAGAPARRQARLADAKGLALLDPVRGRLEPPIRADILDGAGFRALGLSQGQASGAPRLKPRRALPFFPRLKQNIGVLHDAHRFIGLQDRSGHHLSLAGEWLLDNFYLVVAQAKEIRDGLPRRFFRDLPLLADTPLAGVPRVYSMAWAFVAHTDSAFDEALLVEFLAGFQQVRELNLGELWALPTTLRVVLIENLRRLAERVAVTDAARDCANLWCDRIDSPEPIDAAPMVERMRARGVGTAFALQVMQRLHSDSGARTGHGVRNREAIRAALAGALPDPVGAQTQQQDEEVADNLSVGHAITSLRQLGDTDWRGLIAGSSVLVQRMQTVSAFRAERDDTQDATLQAIERLARDSGQGELAVAQTLLRLMPAPAAAGAAESHAAQTSPRYWLRGPGLLALRRAVGLGPVAWLSWGDRVRRCALPAYLATMALGSVGLAAWFVTQFATLGSSTTAELLLGLAALWPASEAVVAMVNRLISESLPPHRAPRLALADGIPAEHRVLVVMPVMLGNLAGIRAFAQQLERHYLANQERHAQFALLSDFADAGQAQLPGDAALLAEAVAQIDALELHHADDPVAHAAADATAARRFLLLHRPRRWSDSEQRWIGWERKRGKLEQLVALLAGQADAAFVDLGGRSQPAANTAYVVTLDSDTGLPPGVLRELVGVAAHPLNRPVLDATAGRVIAGHAILQPRLVTPLPQPHEATPYHWLFAGQSGVDTYSAASSEIYQDLFEEGSFTGKGLLHVGAVHAVLGGRLPEGQVLSHDLLEGALARCGGVSDIALIEEAPMHADVAASRLRRWTRGDWQLLPLLLNPRRFALRAIDLWKMSDNLRRSMVAPVSLLLLLAGLFGGPVSGWAVLALVAAALGGGPLMGALAGLLPARDDVMLRHFYRQALAELLRAAGATLWQLALLLQQALIQSGAIGLALWRSAISRRHLLQWTTAAAAHAAARHDLAGIVRGHWPVVASAVALALALVLAGSPAPGLATLLCLVWGATPLWIYVASRPRPARAAEGVDAADRAYLLAMARDTWRLFEAYVGPDGHHLPPDNVQFQPGVMVAQRTSPTNIGLYLLSLACARQFGWITTAALLQRCSDTLNTVDRLPRHRGHVLNWIDIQTLAPLLPAYVSTVDSGNLCGHLATLAGACEELADAPEDPTDVAAVLGLRTLAQRCRRLADEPDFSFLFDRRRRLFHIGYRVAERSLDKSYYDLLASESRLASLWAIAKGDVPVTHWAALGRPFFAVGTQVGLRSWSGSMFEYLMPALVLDEPYASALASAARAAVHEQRVYAQAKGLPWGMSESAYATSDHTLAYQYAPHGVPRLALRRTPPDELVVAPYASALAAMFEPGAAVANLRWLQTLHARGSMGFVEAIDFTAERQTGGSSSTPVNTVMAHHQGMTIVALANVLLDGAPRRWGMSDPRLASVASLLQERVPREVSRLLEPPPAPKRSDRPPLANIPGTAMVPGEAALPPTQLLSNGRYSVALRGNGAGWSRFNGIDISRWRDDALRDAYGSFFYLRRQGSDRAVSISQHPAPDPEATYQARFHTDRVCLDAHWSDLRSRCTVWVSPQDDVELRHIELWNTSSQTLHIELMSMFELALSDARADEMHPAFANLFVQADWDADSRALYFARKPRRAGEAVLQAVHFIAQADDAQGSVRAQTDRAQWRGPHREPAQPLAHYDTRSQPNAALATGLDPIASLSLPFTLPGHGMTHVTFATAAATDRQALQQLVLRYRQAAAVEHASLLSATYVGIRMSELHLHADDRESIQLLTTTVALLHARPGDAMAADCDRRALWRLGISGDRPLLLVQIGALQGLRLVRSLLQSAQWWAWGGLDCDLVVLNTESASYLMRVRHELQALRDRYGPGPATPLPGRGAGIYLLAADELTLPEQACLATLARLRLNADGRPLSHHVQDLLDWHAGAQQDRLTWPAAVPALANWAAAGRAPRGSFDPASGAYRFTVNAAQWPTRPWINVLANADFGAQVSQGGVGCSWAGNSRLHQLTAWSNDPVADADGEAYFVQDLRSRETWSLGAGAGKADADYIVEHGLGLTTIGHRRDELQVQASWCVDPLLAVKQVRVVITNLGSRTRRLRLVGLVEWTLGATRIDRQSVVTERVALAGGGHALLATQCDNQAGFGGSTAFLVICSQTASAAVLADWTCDRRELFDSRGRRVVADRFGGRAGRGSDPCAAASSLLTLASGQSGECVFLVGHGSSRTAAIVLAQCAAPVPAGRREADARRHWADLLGAVRVCTPDPLFDALVNHWLLYQTVACRLWARAGFYQAGGAFGFRDQLQDAMALATTAPSLLREHLLRASARQFVEGDVQHWWHEPGGAGVRTHFCDDLLWLPHATLRYLDATADHAVLDELRPFLEGPPVPPGAEDAYTVPNISAQQATLFEHGARSIDRSLAVGAHGLPLMGGGDWNDGMNRVGREGRGESVWLGWFLCDLVRRFAPVARARGELVRAQRWEDAAAGWQAALAGPAWDGEWFVRAFFDDGSPLGAHANSECRIDLIAQSWAVLSGAASPERQQVAMASASSLLIDDANGLMRLLDPPLAQAMPDAGYIQAYPGGVRENGGQYTHACVWALMAQAALGQADAAYLSFTRLSPAHRSAHPQQAAAYGLEPYGVAGDVYTQPPYVGRGGWSWYTGAAGWLHRAAVESICGLVVEGAALRLRPQLPSAWPVVTLSLQRAGRHHEIVVCAAWAAADIAAARARGALPLAVGEWLELTAAGTASCHLVIVEPVQTAPSAVASSSPAVPARAC